MAPVSGIIIHPLFIRLEFLCLNEEVWWSESLTKIPT
jgi:hypothetical protein